MTETGSEFEPRPIFEIEDLATLEVLIDPLRMRILSLLIKSALSVKEMAGSLELPTTRLYYHINMLTKAGTIELVETNKVGAAVQRRFRAVARQYAPSDSLNQVIAGNRRMVEFVIALVLEGARVDAESLLTQVRIDPEHPNAKGVVGRTFVTVAPDRAEYWASRMAAVMDEMETEGEQRDDGELYGFTFVFAPLAAPLRGGDAQ